MDGEPGRELHLRRDAATFGLHHQLPLIRRRHDLVRRCGGSGAAVAIEGLEHEAEEADARAGGDWHESAGIHCERNALADTDTPFRLRCGGEVPSPCASAAEEAGRAASGRGGGWIRLRRRSARAMASACQRPVSHGVSARHGRAGLGLA